MTTDLSARLDLRRKSRRRSLLKRAGIVVAAVAVAAALVWLVWFSPVLQVREVEVTGGEVTTPEQVIEVAQVPLGTALAAIDAGAIRERVLSLPAVAAVEVKRNWPDTVVIVLTERQVVYQRVVDGGFQWVDAEGRVFHTSPVAVPGVQAHTATDDERLLRDVATMVSALPPEITEQVDRVAATSIDHLVIYLIDGRIVVWGNAEKSAEKAALLPTLLAMAGNVFDISVPSHPAIR